MGQTGVHHGYVAEDNDALVQVEILADVYVCVGGGISMREDGTTWWIINEAAGRAVGGTDTRAGTSDSALSLGKKRKQDCSPLCIGEGGGDVCRWAVELGQNTLMQPDLTPPQTGLGV